MRENTNPGVQIVASFSLEAVLFAISSFLRLAVQALHKPRPPRSVANAEFLNYALRVFRHVPHSEPLNFLTMFLAEAGI